jgi:hypothetical protein
MALAWAVSSHFNFFLPEIVSVERYEQPNGPSESQDDAVRVSAGWYGRQQSCSSDEIPFRLSCQWFRQQLPQLEASGQVPHVPNPESLEYSGYQGERHIIHFSAF